jgi:hypothetical protein
VHEIYPSDEWEIKMSELEIDLLLLYYSFSDQYGRVDILGAAQFALKNFGYIINKDPFTIDQRHFDFLMDKKLIPDTRQLLKDI